MKEQKTKSKRRILYSLLLAFAVLVLAAATVLTVYFVTDKHDMVIQKPDDVTKPDDPTPPEDEEPEKKPEPDKPTGGETPTYVAPVNAAYSLAYNAIYANGSLGWYYRHDALDFAAAAGESVGAMTGGTVKEISLSRETGNYILIDHGNNLVTCYRFIEPKEGLQVGDTVKTGDVIGTVAEAYGSEASEGEHLHFEVIKEGKNVDPTFYFNAVLAEK